MKEVMNQEVVEMELEMREDVIQEECVSVNVVEEQDFDKEAVKHRTGQLIELMEFDPDNAKIYRNELVELNIRLVPHVL